MSALAQKCAEEELKARHFMLAYKYADAILSIAKGLVTVRRKKHNAKLALSVTGTAQVAIRDAFGSLPNNHWEALHFIEIDDNENMDEEVARSAGESGNNDGDTNAKTVNNDNNDDDDDSNASDLFNDKKIRSPTLQTAIDKFFAFSEKHYDINFDQQLNGKSGDDDELSSATLAMNFARSC